LKQSVILFILPALMAAGCAATPVHSGGETPGVPSEAASHGQPGAVAFPSATPSDETAEAVRPVPGSKKQALTAILTGAAATGAKPSGDPAFYTNNLWEYIDGGAEAFHNFDFDVLAHQVFESGAAEVTADIYDMMEPLNAFGIYSSERSPDYRFLPIGTQGYGDAFSLNFFQGPYYVKLSVYQEGTPDSTLLPKFAGALAANMGTSGKFPGLFGCFPAADVVPNSEKYIKKAPLGHAFLGAAFGMTYRGAGGESVELLAVQSDTPQQRDEKAAKLRAHFKESGRTAEVDGFGPGAFRGSNEYEGSLTVVPSGKWMVIEAAPDSAGTGPLKALLDNLSKLP
jgi:hypothetical protein